MGDVGPSSIEDCVTAFIGGRERDVLHPSGQVGNYERYMKDVHTTFSEGAVGLASCGYLHNMRYDPDPPVFATALRTLIDAVPLVRRVNRSTSSPTSSTASLMGGDGGVSSRKCSRAIPPAQAPARPHGSKMIRNEPT